MDKQEFTFSSEFPVRQRRLRSLKSVLIRNICLKHKIKTSEELFNSSFFFSLHDKPLSSAFYTSRKVIGTLNPTWENINFLEVAQRKFSCDLANESFTIRVWMRNENGDKEENVFIRWDVHLSGLVLVTSEYSIFSNNVILFEFTDGLYTAPFSDKINVSHQTLTDHFQQLLARTSYRLNSLKRMQLTVRAIRELTKKSEELKSIINAILDSEQKIENQKQKIEDVNSHLRTLEQELTFRSNDVFAAKAEAESLHCANEIDELALKENIQRLRRSWEQLRENKKRYFHVREQLITTGAHLVMRRKQLLTDLASIYPITREETEHPTPKTKHWIAGVYLPHSEELAGHDEIMLGVALGYVCHLVHLISVFLDVPLRYPMEHKGSRSTIRDDIIDMLSDREREFPLFAKGQERYQFDYAVYILNKNIVQLRHYCGMPTPNLGSTLANLYTLLSDKLVVNETRNNAFASQHSLVSPSFGGPLSVSSSSLATIPASFNSRTLTTVASSLPTSTDIPKVSLLGSMNTSSETVDWKSINDNFTATTNLSSSLESLTVKREVGLLKRALKSFTNLRSAPASPQQIPKSKFYLTSPQECTPSTSLQSADIFTTTNDDSSGFTLVIRADTQELEKTEFINENKLSLQNELAVFPEKEIGTSNTLTAVASKLDDILKDSATDLASSSDLFSEERHVDVFEKNTGAQILQNTIFENQNGTLKNCSNEDPAMEQSNSCFTISVGDQPTLFKNLMTNKVETPDNCLSSEDETTFLRFEMNS